MRVLPGVVRADAEDRQVDGPGVVERARVGGVPGEEDAPVVGLEKVGVAPPPAVEGEPGAPVVGLEGGEAQAVLAVELARPDLDGAGLI